MELIVYREMYKVLFGAPRSIQFLYPILWEKGSTIILFVESL